MDEARQLLDPRSRGADHADGTAAHPVREAEADSVDDRRPAFGAHHQKPAITRPPLERHLVVQRNAVAEEEHVEPGRKRLVGVDGGVGAGHRDEGHVRRGAPARGARRGARQDIGAGLLGVAAGAQKLVDAREGPVRDRLGARSDRDQEV